MALWYGNLPNLYSSGPGVTVTTTGIGCEEPKPKFKVGDRVRIKEVRNGQGNYTGLNIGDCFTIAEIYNQDKYTPVWLREEVGKANGIEQECCELVPSPQKSVTELLAELKAYDWSKSMGAIREAKRPTTDETAMFLVNGCTGTLGDNVEIKDNRYWFMPGLSFDLINKPTGIKKYMNNIVEFAKNLTLSDDEKVLREVDLKDSEGYWTSSAIRIVQDLEAKELGFKDVRDLAKSLHLESGSIIFSAFELAKAVKNREPRLLEIAREMKVDQEKNCKE